MAEKRVGPLSIMKEFTVNFRNIKLSSYNIYRDLFLHDLNKGLDILNFLPLTIGASH